MAIGEPFWRAISKYKYYSLLVAIILFLVRLLMFETHVPHQITALESILWIYGVIGLGYSYLNKPSKALNYFGPTAYPFYIVHMIFLNLGGYIIFRLNLNAWLSLLLITLFTFAGCFVSYEILKRILFLRPLFGMKIK
ncbi:MAG: hypothetical protein GY865_00165 [candidate division Zixibacteria bacterium]|nr:hypothetical protein [candidate division Zixibacteria bacterium]